MSTVEKTSSIFRIGCGALSFPIGVIALAIVLGWPEFVDGVIRIIEAWKK